MSDFLRFGPGTIFEKGYGLIAKRVMRDRSISIKAKALYAYIVSFAGSDMAAFPSATLIQQDLDINKDSFYKYLGELREQGYITVTKNGRNNLYNIELQPKPSPKRTYPKKSDTKISDTIFSDTTNNSSLTNNRVLTNSINNVSGPSPEAAEGKKETPKKGAEKVFTEISPEIILARLLRTGILRNNPRATKIPKSDSIQDMQGWAKYVDLLIRVDKIPAAEVEQIIKFALTDKFWHQNILSTRSLREKVDQLRIKMQDKTRPTIGPRPQTNIISSGPDKFQGFSL